MITSNNNIVICISFLTDGIASAQALITKTEAAWLPAAITRIRKEATNPHKT